MGSALTNSFTGNKNANGVDFTSLLLSIESVPDSVGNPNTDAQVRSTAWGFLVKGADSLSNRVNNLRLGYAYFSGNNAATTPLQLGISDRRRVVVLQGVAGGRDSSGNTIPQWQVLYISAAPNATDMVNAINSVHPAPALQSYDAWKVAESIPVAVSGPFQDADGDGDENIMEFYFATSPTDPNSRGTPVFSASPPETSGYTYVFNRAKGIAGVNMRLLVSTDLVVWNPVTLTGVNTSTTDMTTHDQVTITLPLDAGNKFYRIELTEPEE